VLFFFAEALEAEGHERAEMHKRVASAVQNFAPVKFLAKFLDGVELRAADREEIRRDRGERRAFSLDIKKELRIRRGGHVELSAQPEKHVTKLGRRQIFAAQF
jgi:hypothetical protein